MREPVTDSTAAGVALPNSSGELLSQLYTELRQLAARKLSAEKPGQTLQATALVHEAWLRLEREQNQSWHGPRHFFCAAAQAMRRILVENARRKQSLKHGGHLQRADGEPVDIAAPLPDDQLLALHEALDELARQDPEAADLVKLRFFAGLTHEQAAEMLGLNRTAADRSWVFARAWLFQRLHGPET